jgi:hypothetical protein
MRPNGKIISLGQSPAWIVTTASLIDNNCDRFDGVAFSGFFYEEVNRPAPFFRRTKNGPTVEQISAYRKYLAAKGMSPSIISQEFSKENPLVIVECTHTGQGLKSFLSVLLDWAVEEGIKIQNKIHIHFLQTISNVGHSEVRYLSDGFEFAIQQFEGDFLKNLANSDLFNDRLLPLFPFFKWDEKRPPVEFGWDISDQAVLVLKAITLKLDSRNLLSAHIRELATHGPELGVLSPGSARELLPSDHLEVKEEVCCEAAIALANLGVFSGRERDNTFPAISGEGVEEPSGNALPGSADTPPSQFANLCSIA